MRLDIEPAEFGIARLRQTTEGLAGGSGLLTEVGIKAIEVAIADCGGDYLPIWEEVERETTSGRGSADDLVRAVRALAEDFHIQLLVRLARHLQARRDGAQVIPLLEEVLRRRPDREEVAHLVIEAYREAGQTIRAQQLEPLARSSSRRRGDPRSSSRR